GFGISRGHVDVAGTIEGMKGAIRNRSQLDDILASARMKIVGQRRRRLLSICPRILVRLQPAGKKELHLLSLQTTAQDRHCPEESFEIPVVIVVAYKKQAESVFAFLKLGFHCRWQGRIVAGKSFRVKSMVHGKHMPATPLAKLLRERFAWGDGNFGAAYGSPRQPA